MIQATSRYSYVGIFFGVAIVLGMLGGHYADRRLHSEPWFTIGGLLLGVACGFRELYRLSKRALRNEEKS